MHNVYFTHFRPEDAGIYTCIATNAAGSARQDMKLLVQGEINFSVLIFNYRELVKQSVLKDSILN